MSGMFRTASGTVFQVPLLYGIMAMFAIGAVAHAQSASFADQVRAFEKKLVAKPARVITVMPLSSPRKPNLHRWIEPESPWHPYLAAQFTNGLGSADQTTHAQLIEAGNCEAAFAFEKVGLLQQHPELRNAMKDPTVQRIFRQIIVPRHAHLDRYCRSTRILKPQIKAARRVGKNVLEFHHLRPSDPKSLSRWLVTIKRIAGAVFVVERLALCDKFKPAILFLESFHEDVAYSQMRPVNTEYMLHVIQEAGIEASLTSSPPGAAELPASELQRLRDKACRIPVSSAMLGEIYPK